MQLSKNVSLLILVAFDAETSTVFINSEGDLFITVLLNIINNLAH